MPMAVNDIYHLIQGGDITLAFDTSVTVRHGFLSLCELAGRINTKRHALGFPAKIELGIPAVAHTERLFDLAQLHRNQYDINRIRDTLSRYQIKTLDFTSSDAEHCAELLAQRYATGDAWHAFRKRRCLQCVGLPIQYHHLADGTGQQCGAPNDWLIIAQASRNNMLLVMEDQGRSGEYDLIQNQVRFTDTRAVLQQILDELMQRF